MGSPVLASAMNRNRMLPGPGWRTPEQAAERHAMMVALRNIKNDDGRPMTLKAISFALAREFGWPLDHSTIVHHLSGRCTCERGTSMKAYQERAASMMLRAVADLWRQKGYAPSVRELQAATWYESTSPVKYQINRLRDMGLVTYEPGIARSLRLTDEGWKAVS